jgi:hypothetical protein
VGSPFVQSNSSSKTRAEESLHFSVRLALRNGSLSLTTPMVELAPASPGTYRARPEEVAMHSGATSVASIAISRALTWPGKDLVSKPVYSDRKRVANHLLLSA